MIRIKTKNKPMILVEYDQDMKIVDVGDIVGKQGFNVFDEDFVIWRDVETRHKFKADNDDGDGMVVFIFDDKREVKVRKARTSTIKELNRMGLDIGASCVGWYSPWVRYFPEKEKETEPNAAKEETEEKKEMRAMPHKKQRKF